MKLKIISKNGAEQLVEIQPGQMAAKVPAQPGARYQFVDAQGKPLAKLKAKRKGSDLELTDEQTGETVTLEAYYEQCAADACTIESPDGTQAYAGESGSVSAAVEALPPGEAIQLVLGPLPVGGALPALALLGLAVVGGGGGGAVAAVAQVASYTISGGLAAGPVVTGHGLTVTAWDKDGNKLGESAVGADGKYSITISTGYKGAVLLKVTDASTGADYFDEATGAAKDLTVDLRAAGSATGSDLTINLNPLTELAVRKLGITTNAATASEADIAATNVKVGELFGLGAGKNITSETPVTVVKADGTVDTAANAYGKALALISGMEKNNGTGTDEVLTNIADSLTGSGSTLVVDPAKANDIKTQLMAAAVTIEGAVAGVTVAEQIAAMDPVIAGATAAPLAWSNSAAAFSVAENGTAAFTGVALVTTSGATVTYTLGGADAALFSVSATGVVTFASAPNYEAPADGGANNVYDLTITVTDSANPPNTLTKTVAVTVTDVNEAPTSTAISAQSAVVNQAYSFNAATTFSDPDATAPNNTLTYSATGLPTGFTIDSAGTITAPAASITAAAAAVAVAVTATDGGGLSTSQTFNLGIVSAPVIQSITSSVAAAKSGAALTFTVTMSEAVTIAGGTPTITFDVGGTAMVATYTGGTGTGALTFTATAPATGDDTTVTVQSISLGGGTVTGNISTQPWATTVVSQAVTSFAVDNTAPTVTATYSTAENAGMDTSPHVITLAANEAVTWSGLTGADAASFSLSGSTLTFAAATSYETKSSYSVSVTGTDTAGNATTQAVTVNLTDVNEAPTSTAISAQTAMVNQAYSFNAATTFSDPDATAPNNTLTYSATGLPTGFTIDSAGTITAPAASITAVAAAVAVAVTATDGGGLSTSQTFNLGVLSAPVLSTSLGGVTNLDVRSKLVLTVGEDVNWTAGGTYTFTLTNTANDATKAGYQTETTVHTQTISVAVDAGGVATSTGGSVTIDHTNRTIVIDPTYDLDLSNNYSLAVATGAFTGVTSTQASLAFTTVNFSTVTPGTVSGISLTGAVQAQDMNLTTGAMQNSLLWIDMTSVGAPTGAQLTLDASTGNYAFVGKGDVLDSTNTQLIGAGNVKFTNFGANDLLYLDDQINSGVIAQDSISNNAFAGGAGTSASPLNITIGGTDSVNGGSYVWDVVVDPAVTLPDISTDMLLANVISNGWSNTGMVIAA